MKLLKGLLLTISIALLTITGINANSTTDTIEDDIFTAIRSIDYTSINVLLADGTDVDTVDQKGNTPLMVATEIGNNRILDIILSHNPDINKQNKNRTTALMIAAESGQHLVVEKLIKHGAELSIRDESGNTALTLASKFGHDQLVQSLKRSKKQAPLAK